MSRIYTKTGDKGETALVGGQRVSKSDVRLEVYGTVDELNSWLGLVRSSLSEALAHTKILTEFEEDFFLLQNTFEELQHRLFDLGSLLAALPADREKYKLSEIQEAQITSLEHTIDLLQAKCPELKEFILPAGPVASCHLQIARTIARRAERHLLSPDFPKEEIPHLAVPYLNRISDFLFVAARFITTAQGQTETPWKKLEQQK